MGKHRLAFVHPLMLYLGEDRNLTNSKVGHVNGLSGTYQMGQIFRDQSRYILSLSFLRTYNIFGKRMATPKNTVLNAIDNM